MSATKKEIRMKDVSCLTDEENESIWKNLSKALTKEEWAVEKKAGAMIRSNLRDLGITGEDFKVVSVVGS